MSGPQLYLTLPTFNFIPSPLPSVVPPPPAERSFRAPFGIDVDIYNLALRPELPVTFASAYIVIVFALNAYNRKRNHKPWWLARQSWFPYFVILHNALLTLYSAATFLAMCRAFARSWPGLNNDAGLVGLADSLCKIHGPRGLGDAATYNTTINIWEVKNTGIKLAPNGSPDSSDVGRLWNEGLAFWGWWFYVSKFYEVLDTLIILAKGKRSATLQTYHHSGAMLCMWAGIRYMSPPIWMFVFVNSFIHALMYTYFTLSALGIRVPTALKRSLTSLQIAQFVWGASYAAAHLFVQYDIPVSTPYQVATSISSVVSSATSAVQASTSAISSAIATPTAVAWGVLGKKLLLRALGEEGLAEKVRTNQGLVADPVMEQKIEEFKEHIPAAPKYETRWRTDWTKVNCIDTTGEAFAIYLNLFYLAPLTFLFARFFYKAYVNRGKPRKASQSAKKILASGKEAEKKTEEKVEQTGARLEKELQKADAKGMYEQLRRDVQSLKNGTYRTEGRRVSEHVQHLEKQVKSVAGKAKQQAKKATSNTGSPRGGSPTKPKQAQTTSNTGSPRGGSPTKPNQAQGVQESGRWTGSEHGVDESIDFKKQASKPEFSSEWRQRSNPQSPKSEKDPFSSSKKDEPTTVAGTTDPSRDDGDDGDEELSPTDRQSQAEPESKQDSNIEATQALRPGVENGLPAEWDSDREQKYAGKSERGSSNLDTSFISVASLDDTDAMGKSGAIVDLAAAKAEEAQAAIQDTRQTGSPVKLPRSPSGSPTKRSGSVSPTKRSTSPIKPAFAPPGTPTRYTK